MAHRFAQEYNVTPWEGLLKAVRIAAGRVVYIEFVLSQATHDLELEGRRPRELTETIEHETTGPTGQARVVKEAVGTGVFVHPDTGEPLGSGELRDLSWWVEQSELWVDRLARYSKAAIDAGVAERLVQQTELEAASIARVLTAALDVLSDAELDQPTRDRLEARMRSRVREELLLMSDEESGTHRVRVIEGSST